MVIGKGLIAGIFSGIDSDELLIFASGVSNSTCDSDSEYLREKTLLVDSINKNKDKKIIYFGTCDVYDTLKKTKYVKHKIEMEELVMSNSNNWLIYRLAQVIGLGNKSNLLYFLVNNILNGIEFNLSHLLYRNLIGKDDLRHLGQFYIGLNREIINLVNPININVSNIVSIIENITGKKSLVTRSYEQNELFIPVRHDYPFGIFSEKSYEDKIQEFIEDFFKLQN